MKCVHIKVVDRTLACVINETIYPISFDLKLKIMDETRTKITRRLTFVSDPVYLEVAYILL